MAEHKETTEYFVEVRHAGSTRWYPHGAPIRRDRFQKEVKRISKDSTITDIEEVRLVKHFTTMSIVEVRAVPEGGE